MAERAAVRGVRRSDVKILTWSVLLGLAFLSGFGVLALLITSHDRFSARLLAIAGPACDPVIEALEAYRREHGVYPPDLQTLAIQGRPEVLRRLPNVPGASHPSGPEYAVDRSRHFYELSFRYRTNEGLGPGPDFDFYFVSDEPGGWKAGRGKSMSEYASTRPKKIRLEETGAREGE